MTLNQHKNKKLRHVIASLKSETMGKMINRIPGSRLMISSKPSDVNKCSQSQVHLISKDTRLAFSISWQASRLQQAFSKPCQVILISKDTHLAFSISRQASRRQQAFLKPSQVHLISKDTHLAFSISRQAWRRQQAFSKPCQVILISKDTHLVFS